MEFSNFNVEGSTSLSVIDTIDIDSEIFEDIIDKITRCMMKLNIKLDNKSIYYQRNANKTSVLAIKVGNGSDNDIANFMFTGCDANYFKDSLSCDVYLHADKKVGQVSMSIANMISSDIVDFFNTVEGELVIKGLSETELFVRIPLGVQTKKKEDSKFLRLVKNIFKK